MLSQSNREGGRGQSGLQSQETTVCNNYKLFINAPPPKPEFSASGNVGQGFQSETYVRPEHQIHVHQINLNNQDVDHDEHESVEEEEGAAREEIGRNGEDRGLMGRMANMGHHQHETANTGVDNSGGMRTAKDVQDSMGGPGALDMRNSPGADPSQRLREDKEQHASGAVYGGTNIATPVQMIPTNTDGCRRTGDAAAQASSRRPIATSISFKHRNFLQQLQKGVGKDPSLRAQDEARHRPLSGHPGDKLIKKADHASTGKQFE